MSKRAGRLAVAAIACASLFAARGVAQEIDALQERFEFLRQLPSAAGVRSVSADEQLKVYDFITKFRTYETQIGRARGSVTFGFTGDSTPSQDQFKANAGIDLEVGTYPSQLRVTTRADVRTSSDELREDVSTFVLNFDHYFAPRVPREYAEAREQAMLEALFLRPRADCAKDAFAASLALRANAKTADDMTKAALRRDYDKDNDNTWDCSRRRQLETYAFTERFSDSFMSIDRRFEVGGGAKLEWHSVRLNDEGADTLGKLMALRASREAAKGVFDTMAGAQTGTPNFDSLFPTSVLDNREAFARNVYSVWEAGVAFSLFRESERPGALATTIVDAAGIPVPDSLGKTERLLNPPVSDADRLTIRPSFIWRPRKEFAFTSLYYYKARLGSGSSVDGVRDARRDIMLRADWRVGELTKDRGSPTIGFVIEKREDPVPPDLDSLSSLLAAVPGGSFTVLAAEREHRQYRLEVKVSF
jgi:hypothetical protein